MGGKHKRVVSCTLGVGRGKWPAGSHSTDRAMTWGPSTNHWIFNLEIAGDLDKNGVRGNCGGKSLTRFEKDQKQLIQSTLLRSREGLFYKMGQIIPYFYTDGNEMQNVSPQSKSLRHKDYFKLKAAEKQQTLEKLSAFPLSTRKGRTSLNHQTLQTLTIPKWS